MKRTALALTSFALSALCLMLVGGPLAGSIPQAAIAFLAAFLLAALGVGILKPDWIAFMVAIAAYALVGYPLWDSLPKTFTSFALVFLGLPTVLVLIADAVNTLLKRWRERRFQRRYFGKHA